jgi:hypothetical protein
MARALNTIITEGKFKGELSIVPRMWDVVLKGLSYDVIANNLHSFVTLLDVGETPTDDLYGACLWEDDNGFCTFTLANYRKTV